MLMVTERASGSVRVVKQVIGESLTEQGHRPLMDVNAIVAKARKGIMPEIMNNNPTYGDFETGEDFFSASCKIARAKQEFSLLPATVKKRFNQDPGELINFLGDEKNRDEAIELGLLDYTGQEDALQSKGIPSGPAPQAPAEPEPKAPETPPEAA